MAISRVIIGVTPFRALTLRSMYSYSIYIGLKVTPYIGTLGAKYILFGYMDPLGYNSTYNLLTKSPGPLSRAKAGFGTPGWAVASRLAPRFRVLASQGFGFQAITRGLSDENRVLGGPYYNDSITYPQILC